LNIEPAAMFNTTVDLTTNRYPALYMCLFV